VVVSLHNPDLPIVGIVLGVALIAQCLSIIPVMSAPAMIAYGAGGFTARDLLRLGLRLRPPFTASSYCSCSHTGVGLWKSVDRLGKLRMDRRTALTSLSVCRLLALR
jgi:di/tricarboxylate transporter